MSNRERVVSAALGEVGYNFRPGEQGQCANFVRHVFREAGVELGVAASPSDQHLIPNEPKAPSYANSFAGDDVGVRVSPNALLPGDIVMFQNTYGNWPRGVITHVGIYVGNGDMVDRPTAFAPVKKRPVSTFILAECRRPLALIDADTESRRSKLFLNAGKARAFQAGQEVKALNVTASFDTGALHVWVDGKEVEPISVTIDIEE